MVATNSVAQRTSNISAGTSFFSMVVLEKPLKDLHTEIDMVTTPDGSLVAMVHSNNGTTDLNAWVNLFKEFADAIGADVDMNQMYGTLYNKALEGDADCGGILSYGNYAGEPITNVEKGRPMVVRTPETKFNLANFMRVTPVYSTWCHQSRNGYPEQKRMCRSTRFSDMADSSRQKVSDRRSSQMPSTHRFRYGDSRRRRTMGNGYPGCLYGKTSRMKNSKII